MEIDKDISLLSNLSVCCLKIWLYLDVNISSVFSKENREKAIKKLKAKGNNYIIIV